MLLHSTITPHSKHIPSLSPLSWTDVIPAENIKENLFIRSDPLVAFDMKAGGDGVNSEGIKERAV